RLLLLVVAADAKSRAAAAPDRVELIDEDDRRRGRPRLGEQVAHARGADADDGLHELRCRLAEERHLRLARHGASKQCLARARRPDEEDPLRDAVSKPFVFLGLAQEIDELFELLLDLVDSGDVRKRGPGPLRVVEPRLALTKGAEQAACATGAGGPADQIQHGNHDQQRGPEAEQQRLPERRRRVLRLGVDRHVVLLEQGLEAVVGERWMLRGEGSGAHGARGRLLDRGLGDPVDRVAGGGHAEYVVSGHLLLEHVIGQGYGRRLRRRKQHVGDEDAGQQDDRQRYPQAGRTHRAAGRRPGWFRGAGRAGWAGRWAGHQLALISVGQPGSSFVGRSWSTLATRARDTRVDQRSGAPGPRASTNNGEWPPAEPTVR